MRGKKDLEETREKLKLIRIKCKNDQCHNTWLALERISL